MVKPDVVARKVARAKAWLADAEKISFYLFLAIQECIDLAAHWVSDAGWDVPDDAATTFDLLAEHEILEPDLVITLRGAVGLRNRIAHGYGSVDHERIHQEYHTGLDALQRFLALVAEEAGL